MSVEPFFSLSRHLIAAAALALTTQAWAVPDAQFQPVFRVFLQANGGDTAQIDKAADGFAALLKAEPANPVLMAYAGAATSLKANTTMLPWRKLSFAEDGLGLIDKALAMLTPAHDAPIQQRTPGTLDVRFVAASTFLAVPGFMNRRARGLKLLDEIMTSALWREVNPDFRGAVLLRAGKAALEDKRADDARKYLNQVIAIGAPVADEARALLKGAAQ